MKIGRIRHADQQPSGVLQQHQRSVAARQRLGQQFYRLPIDACLLQIDVRHLQVLGQQFVQRRFGHEPQVAQYASELAPRAPLLGQCRGELFGGDGPMLDQYISEPYSAFDRHDPRYLGRYGVPLPAFGSSASAWSMA